MSKVDTRNWQCERCYGEKEIELTEKGTNHIYIVRCPICNKGGKISKESQTLMKEQSKQQLQKTKEYLEVKVKNTENRTWKLNPKKGQ